jgi:hypothetical protein
MLGRWKTWARRLRRNREHVRHINGKGGNQSGMGIEALDRTYGR